MSRSPTLILLAVVLAASAVSRAADPPGGFQITDEHRRFWSFQPVRATDPPRVRDAAWPGNEIDRFILSSLEAKGLKPNPSADRRTLIRRATFDLTGLPPTPEEVRAFLADPSPDGEAFAKVVERLLASPAYGEKWGRHWLDVARYADTAGDGSDYPVREAYKYRNYVIDSFNNDKPYDQFLREQIAGDILAAELGADAPRERYAELVTATGYLAVSKRFGYNVTNDPFHHLDIADTIEVLGRSVLGLSVGCARCHDHKYDSVSMRDYYALYGIFQSCVYTFPGGEEHKKPEHLVPLVPPAERQRIDAERQTELDAFDVKLTEINDQRSALYAAADGKGWADAAFELQAPGEAPGPPWYTAGSNTVLGDAQSPHTNAYPAGTRGVRLGPSGPHDGLRQAVVPPRTAANAKVLHFNVDFRTVTPPEGGGAGGSYRFYLGHGFVTSLALDFCANAEVFVVRNGDRFDEVRKIQPGTWYNVQLAVDLEKKTYSGAVGTPGDVATFSDKAFLPGWDGAIDTFFVDGGGHVDGKRPAHDVDNVALADTPFAPVGSSTATEDPATRPNLEELTKKLADLDAAAAEVQKQRNDAAARPMYDVAYGVVEGKPANARIHQRGEPGNPGEEVPRGFLAILGGETLAPDAASTRSGRLELAGWLTRSDNPLTARVMANRIWQWHFGHGLVRTTSDFGTRGEQPTHPELLDYLAANFVADGWSIKSMHRRIMLSRAYRMTGDDRPEATALDPEDRLLWKFPRRRLSAEEIRDAMLSVAGTLDPSPGGEHPFPPVQGWGFTIHNPFYAVYDTNRRSVYLMVQRQKRHPFLALFDGADPNLSAESRTLTTTPTQALYLMNDPFVHEQSAALAKRLLAAGADDPERVRQAWEVTQAREPGAEELAQAVDFVQRYRDRLAAIGKSAEGQQAGAWSAYARVLLTSNGFLYVD